MRVDAKSLLDRLGRSEFNYREFADRFSELELWPLFEALLHDQRLSSISPRDVASGASAANMVQSPEPEGAHVSASRDATSQSFSSLFARLEASPAPVERQSVAMRNDDREGLDLSSQDVRTLLRQLAEMQRKGEL